MNAYMMLPRYRLPVEWSAKGEKREDDADGVHDLSRLGLVLLGLLLCLAFSLASIDRNVGIRVTVHRQADISFPGARSPRKNIRPLFWNYIVQLTMRVFCGFLSSRRHILVNAGELPGHDFNLPQQLPLNHLNHLLVSFFQKC